MLIGAILLSPWRRKITMKDQKQETKVYKVEFTLESLTVFSIAGMQVYWQDSKHPQAAGPFASVWECMEDYKRTYLRIKAVPIKGWPSEAPLATIISVDFKAKKRI
jgi:hypothetical protein